MRGGWPLLFLAFPPLVKGVESGNVANLIFLGLAVWALRKLPMTYALYTVVMVLLPLSNSRINSISRYYLVVFPVFILLALWTCREGNRVQSNAFIMVLFASLQAVFMVFFVLGLPAIA